MPSGDMRRPPSVWEQRLAGRVNAVALGIDSAASSVVRSDDSASTSYSEPEDTILAAGAPSTPTLTPTFKGLAVTWDGLDVDGDAYNGANQWVQVHVSTTSTFTPSSSTLMGHLYEPGTFIVSPLTPGAAYYVKFVGIDETGTVTDASVEAAETSAKVNGATDIVANSISANLISAGTITGWYISGGTVEGAQIRTAGTGSRVEIGATGRSTFVDLYDSSNTRVGIYQASRYVYFDNALQVVMNDLTAAGSAYVVGKITGAQLEISGSAVDMAGVYGNNTTGIDSVGITTGYRLRRISSSQAIKYDIATLSGTLSDSVDPGRLSDVATVDPAAILDVAVTEFSVIDGGEPTDRRVLGFIADDVADKLPIAVTRYEDGTPAGVLDTSILAAVLAVVQDQQSAITALSARIDELEAR